MNLLINRKRSRLGSSSLGDRVAVRGHTGHTLVVEVTELIAEGTHVGCSSADHPGIRVWLPADMQVNVAQEVD